MPKKKTITLDEDECAAVYSIVDMLSGGNASNVFNWEDDDPKEVENIAFAKIFKMAGAKIPKTLESVA